MLSSFSAARSYRPGIVASRDRRIADAHMRAAHLLKIIENMSGASVPEMVSALNEAGYRASRGGPVSHNTVTRALGRVGQEAPVVPRSNKTAKLENRKSIRARAKHYEVFRTPASAYKPLLDYRPEWFTGRGFDPSAGDGRMIRELMRRGNPGPHFVNDIREEEIVALSDCGQVTIGDYLSLSDLPSCNFMLTNPPFTKAQEFVEKARQHVSGPICVLQTIQWMGSQKRSKWFQNAGLAEILVLPKRPQWEVDSGDRVKNNIWDYAWFVFLPGHYESPKTCWLRAS